MIGDRYILQEELGHGAMGQVFKARDKVLQRFVAVKLLAKAADDDESQQRLMIEAQAIAQLNHPNIVAVYDAGIERNTPYVVMELLDGKTLAQSTVTSIEETVAIVDQICAALEEAHRQGIVHRDLKPSNVIITHDGTIKLMDFGLARMSNVTRVTQEGAIIGTFDYLAPEIIQGRPATPQSDLYALGVILFEMIAGKPPFEGENPTAVLSQHLYAPVVRPSTFNEEAPAALDDLIFSLLEKIPDNRPQSAAAVRQALTSILESGDTQKPAAVLERPMLDRLVRGRLIGREQEFARATSFWKKAAAGSGQVLLVSGEPGIGKTRLIRELTTHVELTGAATLIGECYPGGGAPFAPFTQILNELLDESETAEIISQLPDMVLADLITLAPSLSNRFPKLSSNPGLDPESEQQRMFESVYRLIVDLTQLSPLLMVIDDIHWSDKGTLLLLHHLARRSRSTGLPLLIVLTYREVEIAESTGLKSLLLNLSRERLSNRLKLMRLDRTQVEELLGAMLAEEITPDFLEGIYQETEGNPFFIEEVCKALIEDGQLSRHGGQWHRPDDMNEMEIPQSIRLAIESRLDKLPADTQETLRLAAVIGREFDFDTLLGASHADEESVIESLETADRVDIISEIRPSRGGLPAGGEITFSFAHALIPTTIYDSTSALRLRRLHGRVGTAIETRRPSDFESLAYHYAAAGQADKAIDYALRAAEKAKIVHAYDASVNHLQRALSLLDADSGSVERLRLLEELGDVHWTLGQDKLAISEFRQALDNLRSLTSVNPVDALRLHSKIITTAVRTVWLSDLQEFQLDLIESKRAGIRLLEQVPPNEDSNRLLQALSREAWRNRSVPDWDAAENYAQRAIEQAEQLNDPAQLSSALEALQLTYDGRGLYEKHLAVTKRRLSLVQDPNFNDPREKARILNAHGHSLLRVGQYDEAIVYFQETEKFSEQIQDISQQVMAMVHQSDIWFHLDQWDNVLANEEKWRGLQQRFPNFIERVGPICFLVALSACVRGRRGELQEAEDLRQESHQIMVAAEGGIERWDRYNYY